MKFFLILFLLPLSASAKDLYQIYTLSEKKIQQTFLQLLDDACRSAGRDWTNSSFDPAAGHWGDGGNGSNNGGIRTVGSMVLACGTLLKYDDGLGDGERRDLLAKAAAGLRNAVATHFTGRQKCTDGKQWGGLDRPGSKAWQSSYWTGSLAFGAWLIWEKLDPGLQQDIERVVAAQDDLMAAGNPPTGLWSDTNAEENGWDVPCLVLGELMFPSHPHHAVWRETALKYWELHDLPFIDLYGTLGTHGNDPFAARMEQMSLQYLHDCLDLKTALENWRNQKMSVLS
jgi:hypothetical protein